MQKLNTQLDFHNIRIIFTDGEEIGFDSENKNSPLSDQALSEALAKKGIKIARRTVAKYREENLKILSARLRKIVGG